MRIILSHQASGVPICLAGLSAGQIGTRRMQEGNDSHTNTLLLPQTQPHWHALNWRGDWYVFFLTSAPAYITFKNGQKRGLTYSVDRSQLPNSHCLDVGGCCTAARLAHRCRTNPSRSLLIRLCEGLFQSHLCNTVLFRSIRPSRVTRLVDMAEIGCFSCVTDSLAGIKIRIGTSGASAGRLRPAFWPKILVLSPVTRRLDDAEISSTCSQVTPLAELIEIVQYA